MKRTGKRVIPASALDEEKAIIRRILTMLILTSAAVLLGLAIQSLIANWGSLPPRLFTYPLVAALLLTLIIPIRKGNLFWPSLGYLLVAFSWLTWMAATGDGNQDTALLGYIVIALAALILIGRTIAVLFLAISLISIWVLASSVATGAIVPKQVAAWFDARDFTASFILIGSLMFAFDWIRSRTHRRLAEELEEKRLAEAALQQSEEELRLLNDSLEKRIREKIEELRSKDALLIHQARLAAMGEILSSISHQWRQPLNAMSVMVQNIRYRSNLGSLDTEYVCESTGKVIQIAERLSQTIDQFRRFIRPSAGVETFDLDSCLEAARLMSSPLLEEHRIGYRLINRLPGDNRKLQVRGNSEELIQVFLLLFTNVCEIADEREISDPEVTLELSSDESLLIFSFRDNAGGIPEVILPKIFEPYFSTKTQLQGRGLGLTICRLIVEKSLSGSISAKNEGSGAAFEIRLPKDQIRSEAVSI